MKLYAPWGNYRAAKALIAAQYAEIELIQEDPTRDADLKARLEKISSTHGLPILQTTEGYIVKSNAIARHLAKLSPSKGLYGATFHEQSEVDSWLDFSIEDLEPALQSWTLPVLGHMADAGQVYKGGADDSKHLLKGLDAHLTASTFLVGHQITLADIVIACDLVLPFRLVMDANIRKNFPNVERWFNTCIHQAEFVAVLGGVQFCKKAHHPQKGGPKGGKKDNQKKEKKEKPKKEEKKKEEKPKEEKPKKEEKKDEFAVLPPTKFDIEWWKRLYSNAANKREVMPQFWEAFDAAGWSIWYVEYEKAEGEGTVLFMTSNLVKGFLQRFDKLRKWAFATHGVYGDEPKLEIFGCWMWRGTEIPTEMKEHPSFEYHKLVKLDTSDAAARARIEDHWCNFDEGLKTDGLVFQDGNWFK